MTNEELVANIDLSKPLHKARSSEVFEIPEDKVLKLLFETINNKAADNEYLNATVAYEKDCTPMKCYGKVSVNNRNGLIFKKLKGCLMTDLPTKNPLLIFKAGKILAELHVKTHSKTSPKLRDVRVVATDALNSSIFNFLNAQEINKLIKYINSLPAADNIIHLDFHTDNIMCDSDQYQVIDWMTACRGNPLAEIAMMNFLFHHAELFPGSSKLKIFVSQSLRTIIFNDFIKHYERMSGISLDDSKAWDIVAHVLRLGIWNIESEKEFLQKKIKEFIIDIEE